MTRADAPRILVLGDPRLRVRCDEVERVDDGELARLATALAEARGRLGFGRAIAAPQVGIARRIILMNLGAGAFAVINPEITWRSDERFDVWDDCLSVPDRLVRVSRHRSISLVFRDSAFRRREWRRLPEDLSELLQHEIDHLDGVLMVDRAVGEDAMRPIDERGALVEPGRPKHRLSLERIAEAARIIDPVFLGSAQFVCEPLAEVVGCRLTLKVETVNPIRSFKGRGADYLVGQLVARAGGAGAAMVCASAGNFGQGMAYACRKHGIPLVVFAASGASPLKLARMRGLGAEVRLAGDDLEDARQAARAWAAARGARLVEDGLEPAISEGAGSIAVELIAGGEAFDAIVVPVGDGALASGIARWTKAASPSTRVIGVCSRGAPMARAWRRPDAAIVPAPVDTIADGIAIRAPFAASLADLRSTLDDIVELDDDALVEAMRLLYAHAGLVSEPAGVAGLAALVTRQLDLAGARVATVIAGGNATHDQLVAWRVI